MLYPAALAALTLAGNYVVLGKKLDPVTKDISDMKVGLGKMETAVGSLEKRAAALEAHDMSVAEELLRTCGKSKKK